MSLFNFYLLYFRILKFQFRLLQQSRSRNDRICRDLLNVVSVAAALTNDLEGRHEARLLLAAHEVGGGEGGAKEQVFTQAALHAGEVPVDFHVDPQVLFTCKALMCLSFENQ